MYLNTAAVLFPYDRLFFWVEASIRALALCSYRAKCVRIAAPDHWLEISQLRPAIAALAGRIDSAHFNPTSFSKQLRPKCNAELLCLSYFDHRTVPTTTYPFSLLTIQRFAPLLLHDFSCSFSRAIRQYP